MRDLETGIEVETAVLPCLPLLLASTETDFSATALNREAIVQSLLIDIEKRVLSILVAGEDQSKYIMILGTVAVLAVSF